MRKFTRKAKIFRCVQKPKHFTLKFSEWLEIAAVNSTTSSSKQITRLFTDNICSTICALLLEWPNTIKFKYIYCVKISSPIVTYKCKRRRFKIFLQIKFWFNDLNPFLANTFSFDEQKNINCIPSLKTTKPGEVTLI